MKSLTLVRENIAFYLVLIFSTCPTLTSQALSSGLRYPNTAEAKDNTLAQSAISTPYAFRNSGVPVAVNITLENVGGSLARLEENLSGLIQSFTAVQRSVFNLEQLQELLVLLLEDILKQVRYIFNVAVLFNSVKPILVLCAVELLNIISIKSEFLNQFLPMIHFLALNILCATSTFSLLQKYF